MDMTVSISDLKVLIVDDNKFMVNMVKRILDKLEIAAPLEANDGADALERLDEAAVDVIVCDLNMPDMDGIEFLRHLASREAHPAVILLSGEDKSVLNTAVQLGQAHGLSQFLAESVCRRTALPGSGARRALDSGPTQGRTSGVMLNVSFGSEADIGLGPSNVRSWG